MVRCLEKRAITIMPEGVKHAIDCGRHAVNTGEVEMQQYRRTKEMLS